MFLHTYIFFFEKDPLKKVFSTYTVVPHLYQLALISTLTYITEMQGTDGLQYISMLN